MSETTHKPAFLIGTQSDSFMLHQGLLVAFDGDLDAHAKGLAGWLFRSGLDAVLIMAAVGGVGEMLAAHWTMNEGYSGEAAVAQMHHWRKLVLQRHAWDLIAAANRTASQSRQDVNREHRQ